MANSKDDWMPVEEKDDWQPVGQLPRVSEISPMESLAGGAVQGGLYEFGDEAYGAVGGLWDLVTKGDFRYTENRDQARAYFDRLAKANPASYMTGNVAGAVISPASKVLGGIGTVAKMGKWANVPKFAIEGAVFGTGASKEDTPLGVLKDTAIGATTGAIGGRVAEKGMQALGKGYTKAAQFFGDPERQRKAILKTAQIAGDMPKEWTEFIANNPETFKYFGRNIATPDELSFVVADKVNTLRKTTDDIYRQLDDILSDQPSIHYPSIKGLVTKFSKSRDVNPRGLTGKRIGFLTKNFEDMLEYRVKQFQKTLGDPKDIKHFKISPKQLRKIVLDLGDDIKNVSATTLKNPPEVRFMEGLNKKLRKFMTNQMLKEPKLGKEYQELMEKAAKGEDLWNTLASELKLRKPSFVEQREGLENLTKRANLEPSRATETVLVRYPSKNIKLYRTIDKLDQNLRKKIQVTEINRRTEGGVARGSRNVQFFRDAGKAIGLAAGGSAGFAGGGFAGAGIGGLIGREIGGTLGAGVGYLADRIGRKTAKKFIIEYAPRFGGVSPLNQRLEKLSPAQLEKLAGYLKNNSGAAASALLMGETQE